jgi:hypothetical protein
VQAACFGAVAMSLEKFLVLTLIIVLPFDATEYLHLNLGTFNINPVDIVILLSLIIVILKHLVIQVPIKITSDLLMFLLLAFGCSLINLAWLKPSGFDLKISLNYLEYLALFYVFSQVIRDEAFIKRLLRLFLLIVTCVSVFTILMSLGFELPCLSGLVRKTPFSLWVFRIGVVGLEGQFAPFSLFLAGAIPLLWQKTLVTQRWLRIVLNVLFFLAALVTGARGLYVSLIALIVAWAYFGYFRSLTGKKRLIAFVGLILGVVFLAALSLPFLELMEKMRPQTVDQRGTNYLLALNLATSDILNFLFGYGKSQFISTTNISVHNFLLDILVSKGALTLIFVIALYSAIFYRLVRMPGWRDTAFMQIRMSLMMGFFGMVMVGLFDVITSSIIFWTYLALIYAYSLIPRKKAANFNFSSAYQVSRV